MMTPNQETDSRLISDDTSGSVGDKLFYVTTGAGDQTGAFSLYGEPDPVSQAKSILSTIGNHDVAEQVRKLLLIIHRLIEIAREMKGDIGCIPPIHA